MLAASAAWMALAIGYLLLAGVSGADEIVAAAAGAALAVAFAALIRAAAHRTLALRGAPWLRLLARASAQLAADSARVGRSLAAACAGAVPHGKVLAQPFRHGDDGPAEAGRRAMVTLLASLAPNGYVLDLPDGAEALLLHQLSPRPPRPDAEWPL